MIIIILVLWICVAIGISLYARKSGMKFWAYFLISLFFTPLVAVIVFAVESSQIRQRHQTELLEKIAKQKTTLQPR